MQWTSYKLTKKKLFAFGSQFDYIDKTYTKVGTTTKQTKQTIYNNRNTVVRSEEYYNNIF